MFKRLIFILALSILQCLDLAAQWNCIYFNDSLSGIHALNKDTVFAVGYNCIMRSSNGGDIWQNMLKIPLNALDVTFTENSTGYVSGFQKILKTTNGGNTWNVIKVDSSHNWYDKLCFPTSQLGFVRVYNYYGDTVLRTSNGGLTWTPVLYRQTINDISMIDETTGYIASDSLFKTTDGGITWNNLPLQSAENHYIKLLGFSSKDTGLILLVPGGNLRKTLDGGATWELITSIPEFPFASYFSCFYPVDGNRIYFCGWDPIASIGAIEYSSDGGYHWLEQKRGLFNKLKMVTDSIGYAIDVNLGVYKTDNGGLLVGINIPKFKKNEKFTIQPNPVKDIINIYNNESISMGIITISNTQGRQLIVHPLTPSGNTSISFLSFQPGIYFYTISQHSRIIETGKFVKFVND